MVLSALSLGVRRYSYQLPRGSAFFTVSRRAIVLLRERAGIRASGKFEGVAHGRDSENLQGRPASFFSKKNWITLTLFVSEWVKGEFVPQIYWGQDGEDVFLADALPGSGFYVDVGAHHPYRFSSTKLLYDRGWSGLNIDVTEAMHTVFPRSRGRFAAFQVSWRTCDKNFLCFFGASSQHARCRRRGGTRSSRMGVTVRGNYGS